jgi:phage N-6-adenine-methyltransferase
MTDTQGSFVTLWRVTKRGRPPLLDRPMTDAERARRYRARKRKERKRSHLTRGRGDSYWNTPAAYVEAAREVLGTIDLDPATNLAVQERVRAQSFHTAEDNGLAHEWRGRVWLNPPYAQPLISQFVTKLVQEVSSGRVTAAILLTKSSTDTLWFHEAVTACAAVCYTRGRIRFEKAEGKPESPLQGSAFFYFGSDVAAFRKVFGDVGFVR